ncbi:MAG: FAD-dependent oxidoreductase, partial [Candidatus Schekmanbacteria bacterium]
MPKKIAVLGAGATGLAAGWRLSKKGCIVTVIDQLPRVGGLAGGVLLNGNIYEYGPHAFHTTDEEILNDIKEIAKGDLIKFNRTITIKFLDSYFKYPLAISDVLLKLPTITVIKAFFSLLWNMIKGYVSSGDYKNSEEVLVQNYGYVLYKI